MMEIIHSSSSPSKTIEEGTGISPMSGGVTSSETSTVWICLQTVMTKFFGMLEIGIGSETLNSEE